MDSADSAKLVLDWRIGNIQPRSPSCVPLFKILQLSRSKMSNISQACSVILTHIITTTMLDIIVINIKGSCFSPQLYFNHTLKKEFVWRNLPLNTMWKDFIDKNNILISVEQ